MEELNEKLTKKVSGGTNVETRFVRIGDPVVERMDFCSKCGKPFKIKSVPWMPLGQRMCEECRSNF